MDGQNGVPAVIFLEEKSLEFSFFEFFPKNSQGSLKVFSHALTFFSELGEDFDFFLFFFQNAEKLNVPVQLLFFLLQRLEFFLVLPRVRPGQLSIEGFCLRLFAV
jgi:hypothetical protein